MDDQRQPALPSALARRLLVALLVSVALVFASFAWQSTYGLVLSDEGFLWYGAQRVKAGEVPLLDFMAYDPGRYYWSAALMALLHDDGIIALRIALAAFQLLGFCVALLLLRRGESKFEVVLFMLAAITLLVWMYPRHKLFDISLSIFLIGILTLLLEQPSRRGFFFAGVGLGLVAVFGRNHGSYGVGGLIGVVAYLVCRRRNAATLLPGLLWCGCGTVVGYLPILLMAVAVPGFAVAFWDSVRAIFQRGTNLPLPVPWPWLVPVTQLAPSSAAADVLIGILFIAILMFGILSIGWIVRRALRRQAVPAELVACAVLALPYAHFAFSRADASHLAQAIFPSLIGFFVVLRQWRSKARWPVAVVVTATSLFVMLPLHPGWECRVTLRCVTAGVAGSELTVDTETGRTLTMLTTMAQNYAPNGRILIVAPIWPGAYSVLKRKSPMWEIYALFPQQDEFQRREIERIKAAKPGLILIVNIALDGHDELRFRNSHRLIEQYVRDNFDPISLDDWPPHIFQFYKSR